MKVWYGPIGLGLGQGHGETACAPLYYTCATRYLINTLYTHNTESYISTPNSETWSHHVPVIAWPSLKVVNYEGTHSLSSGGLSGNLVWYTCVVSNTSSENETKEWQDQTVDRSNCTLCMWQQLLNCWTSLWCSQVGETQSSTHGVREWQIW